MNIEVCHHARLSTSIDATWQIVGDFCPAQQWNADIVHCAIVSGKNNEPGAVREFTVRNGATVRERLVTRDPGAKTLAYLIIDSPLPVADYHSTLSVSAGEHGGSIVQWKGTFLPATGVEVGVARAIIDGIYDGGLKSLLAIVNRFAPEPANLIGTDWIISRG